MDILSQLMAAARESEKPKARHQQQRYDRGMRQGSQMDVILTLLMDERVWSTTQIQEKTGYNIRSIRTCLFRLGKKWLVECVEVVTAPIASGVAGSKKFEKLWKFKEG